MSWGRELRYHGVPHPLFQTFSERSRDLLRSLAETAGDPDWVEFIRTIRRVRFDLCVAPLPFTDHFFAPRLDEPGCRRFAALTARAFPRFAADVNQLVDLLFGLRSLEENPLLAAIEAIIAPTSAGDLALLLVESRFAEPVRSLFAGHSTLSRIEIVTASALRGVQSYHRIIVVGPARWFPSFIFNASRAEQIDVVSYSWLPARWRPTPSFLAANPATSSQDDIDDIAPAFDWLQLEQGLADLGRHETAGDLHDQIEARLYLLDGGKAVFLDATGRRATVILDLESEGHTQVRQAADADIEPGMFVILRTDSGGDYIAPVADRLLGAKAVSYRAAQRRWKDLLRNEVRRYGLSAVSTQLSVLGAGIADETNLRNWASDRNIAPRDKRDFDAIARLVGLSQESDNLFAIARQVRAAHYLAGTKIRGWLLERVRGADMSELEKRGHLDFALPEVEGGRLTAFRVEHRSSHTIRVPSGRVERVLSQEP